MNGGSQPYSRFEQLLIGEAWRPGRAGQMLADKDPYTGATLAEISLADERDVDDAYRTAQRLRILGRKAIAEHRPTLFDSASDASSSITSQCSTRTPSTTRTMSAAIQFFAAPKPENRPCTIRHVSDFLSE